MVAVIRWDQMYVQMGHGSPCALTKIDINEICLRCELFEHILLGAIKQLHQIIALIG